MAVVATISKTGIGIGELCNVDMGDIDFASDSGITTPFAGPGIRVRYGGDIPYNNRRERSHETVVPIDTELEVLLRRWIAIRPDPDQTDALFLETKGNWGNRIQPSTVRYIFEKIGRENGCYSQNDQLENFTPVALRYFFEERFQGRPQHRDYILGRLDRSEIDLSTLENDYRASIFRLFSDGP
ncbi:tyrosine-type recombinase/integrase [Natrinema pellirubrum]